MRRQGFLIRGKHDMYYELTDEVVRLYRICIDNPAAKLMNPTLCFRCPQPQAILIDSGEPWLMAGSSTNLRAYSLLQLHRKPEPINILLPSPPKLICHHVETGFIFLCSGRLYRFDPREAGRKNCRAIEHSDLGEIDQMQVAAVKDGYVIRGMWQQDRDQSVLCVWVRGDKQQMIELGRASTINKDWLFQMDDADGERGGCILKTMPRYAPDGHKALELVRLTSRPNSEHLQILRTRQHFNLRFGPHVESLNSLHQTPFGLILSQYTYQPQIFNSLFLRSQRLLNSYSKNSSMIYYNLDKFFSQKQFLFYKVLDNLEMASSSSGYEVFKIVLNEQPEKLKYVWVGEQKELEWLMALSRYCQKYIEENGRKILQKETTEEVKLGELQQFHNQIAKRVYKQQEKTQYEKISQTSNLISSMILALSLQKQLILSYQQPLQQVFNALNYRRKFIKYLAEEPSLPRLFLQYFPSLFDLITPNPPSFTQFLMTITSIHPFLCKYFAYELFGQGEKGYEGRVAEVVVTAERTFGGSEASEEIARGIDEVIEGFHHRGAHVPAEVFLYLAAHAFRMGTYSKVVRLLECAVDWLQHFEEVAKLYAACRELPRMCSQLKQRIGEGRIPGCLLGMLLETLSSLACQRLSRVQWLYSSVCV